MTQPITLSTPYRVIDVTLTSGFLFKRLCHALAGGRTNKEDGRHETFTVPAADFTGWLDMNESDEFVYSGLWSTDWTHWPADKIRVVQGWED